MPRVALPPPIILDLSRQLGGLEAPAESVSVVELKSRGFLPVRFEWEPDACLLHDHTAWLIHAVAAGEIPDWVAEPMGKLSGRFRRSRLVVLVRRNTDSPTWKAAAALVDRCVKLRAGLAVEMFEGCCLVFPPDLVAPKTEASPQESGHIPSWILDRLTACDAFSPYLRRCFARFVSNYHKLTARRPPSYDEESDVLLAFARSLRRGDPRVYFPIDLLSTLATWERRASQGQARDHFFHTFNNLFMGFLILGELFRDRPVSARPDKYIGKGRSTARLSMWEVLWALTCLFHDPGYITEKIWVTISFACGIPNQLPSDAPIPEAIREQLNNAWDVDHKDIAEDIGSLFDRLTKGEGWTPPRLSKKANAAFHGALRKVYFDGSRVGHSLQSGIHLINYCANDKTPPHRGYNPDTALTACEIAALSMMFHDQHCRNVMREAQVPPLTFEQLPYSAVLMFVDALQDDRRDITKNTFNRDGLVVGLDVLNEGNRKVVRARVCLSELPITWWPGKIEEYEDVLRWINSKSKTRFEIDYQTRAWRVPPDVIRRRRRRRR